MEVLNKVNLKTYGDINEAPYLGAKFLLSFIFMKLDQIFS
jgi:hypothetical protein